MCKLINYDILIKSVDAIQFWRFFWFSLFDLRSGVKGRPQYAQMKAEHSGQTPPDSTFPSQCYRTRPTLSSSTERVMLHLFRSKTKEDRHKVSSKVKPFFAKRFAAKPKPLPDPL
jgi:hypothetical protein